MRRLPRLLCLSLLLLPLLAGALSAQEAKPAPPAAPLPSVVLPPELTRVLTDYEAAWSKKDAAALSRLFAEDGFVLPSSHPPARGRAAIEAFYTGHGGPLFLRAFAYAIEGKTGYILGGYAAEAGGPDDGKFTLTLRKGDEGRWWIFSDMDNGNRRPNPGPVQ